MNGAFLRRHPKWLALILALSVVVAVVVCLLDSRVPDPTCNGRPLSQWLPLIGSSAAPAAQKQGAIEAIQQIGTNAVPSLLAWMAYEPPLFRYNLIPICQRLPRAVLVSRPVQRLLADPQADKRAENAVVALAALGPAAASAIPELLQRASQPWFLKPASAKRSRAMRALEKLGPPALSVLTAQLSSPGGAGDPWVMGWVMALGTNAHPLVPVLITNLKHTNCFAAMFSARMLGELKLDPDLAIPALTKCLQDPRQEVRAEVPPALTEFGDLARQALPVLTNALSDTDVNVRANAARAIQRIARQADANPPTS